MAGDERAWRHLVDQYGRLIYAVGGRTGLTDSERDDHFQNTCVALVGAIHQLRDTTKLTSWLYSIAYRNAVDLVRRRRGGTVSLDEPDGQSTFEPVASEPDALARLEELATAAQVADLFTRLDERCCRLLNALYLQDPRPSYTELAAQEGIPIGSIGPTRARCLEKARRLMGDVSSDEPGATLGADPRRGEWRNE